MSWIHGLGHQSHVALYEDPVLLQRKMAGDGVRFSQVAAAFPLSGRDGPRRGVLSIGREGHGGPMIEEK